MNRRSSNLLIVLGFTVVSLGAMEALALQLGQPNPFGSNYTLHADFADASGIVTNADVRVSGVDVGHVTNVGADPGNPGYTEVTIEITDTAEVPVFSNGSADVRSKSMLGDKYVDLIPGGSGTGTAIPSGGSMPVAMTGSDISDDEIFNSLDSQTRTQLQQVVQALDTATAGHAGDIRAILPQLQTVTSNLDTLAQTYSSDSAEVDATLVNLDVILASTADEHTQVAGLIDHGSTVIGTIASRDQALITTLQRGASLAGEINDAAAPTISAQRQSLALLAPTLSTTNTLLNQIDGPQPACGDRACGIDEVIAETLDGNINYPNDQLSITSNPGESVTNEWASMFSQPAGAGTHRALNLVLAFHCDEVQQTLGEVLPGLSRTQQKAIASACSLVAAGSGTAVPKAPALPSPASLLPALPGKPSAALLRRLLPSEGGL